MLRHPGRFDVVFCDVALPDGDGLQLAATAQSLRIPAVSVAATSVMSEASRRAGCVAHLCKPIEADAVDAILRDLADPGRSGGWRERYAS
jgi:CheY-like chemotaxis protein